MPSDFDSLTVSEWDGTSMLPLSPFISFDYVNKAFRFTPDYTLDNGVRHLLVKLEKSGTVT